MKSYLFYLLFLLNMLFINAWSAMASGRQHLSMDYNWKFIRSNAKGAEKQDFDDTKWRTLNLPHDWSIEGEFTEDAPTKGNGGFLPTGIGWYRKHFSLSVNPKEQNVWIEFDGVYMNSDVWINGQHLGNHPYGYTSFYYELSGLIILFNPIVVGIQVQVYTAMCGLILPDLCI
jgi:beta-galactosidase